MSSLLKNGRDGYFSQALYGSSCYSPTRGQSLEVCHIQVMNQNPLLNTQAIPTQTEDCYQKFSTLQFFLRMQSLLFQHTSIPCTSFRVSPHSHLPFQAMLQWHGLLPPSQGLTPVGTHQLPDTQGRKLRKVIHNLVSITFQQLLSYPQNIQCPML